MKIQDFPIPDGAPGTGVSGIGAPTGHPSHSKGKVKAEHGDLICAARAFRQKTKLTILIYCTALYKFESLGGIGKRPSTWLNLDLLETLGLKKGKDACTMGFEKEMFSKSVTCPNTYMKDAMEIIQDDMKIWWSARKIEIAMRRGPMLLSERNHQVNQEHRCLTNNLEI